MKTFKIKFFLVFLGFLLASCTLGLNVEEVPAGIGQEIFATDEVEINYANILIDWKSVICLEDRFAVCDQSIELAQKKTTEALVRSILDYPLNYLIFCYNKPQDAVSLIIENSSIHRELFRRNDAGEILLKYYKDASICMSNLNREDEDYSSLPYSSVLFLEYYLCSKQSRSLFENRSSKLESVVKKNLSGRLSQKDVYSSFSIAPLLEIAKVYGFDIDYNPKTRAGGDILGYTNIYTPLNGQVLEGMLIEELSASEISIINAEIVNAYPNAVMLSPSSTKYNCHSYAWHSQSANNNIWLNAWNNNGVFQLSRYWVNDLYDESFLLSGCDIVFYQGGDHSAVRKSSNQVVSKWGRGPLMKHAVSYCPYLISANRFFYKMGEPGLNGSISPERRLIISGDSQVITNTVHIYSLNGRKDGRTYQWTFRDMVNMGANNTFEYICLNPNTEGTYSLKCNTYSAFQIRVDELYDGRNTAYGELLVISFGE